MTGAGPLDRGRPAPVRMSYDLVPEWRTEGPLAAELSSHFGRVPASDGRAGVSEYRGQQHMTVATLDLPIHLQPGMATYRQVAERIRSAILEGRLAPGARLPGTRALARQLGVVRNVAAEAYDVLAGEGYLVARHGSGTYVSQAIPDGFGPPLSAVGDVP
ncbi:MAG TPA: winged helix-turn-helix domain-containing protein, partial [Chloroflexota bacterium]|nr:winged helix-turn-helix domain-containing protein [Chloroflexota bacterium]